MFIQLCTQYVGDSIHPSPFFRTFSVEYTCCLQRTYACCLQCTHTCHLQCTYTCCLQCTYVHTHAAYNAHTHAAYNAHTHAAYNAHTYIHMLLTMHIRMLLTMHIHMPVQSPHTHACTTHVHMPLTRTVCTSFFPLPPFCFGVTDDRVWWSESSNSEGNLRGRTAPMLLSQSSNIVLKFCEDASRNKYLWNVVEWQRSSVRVVSFGGEHTYICKNSRIDESKQMLVYVVPYNCT